MHRDASSGYISPQGSDLYIEGSGRHERTLMPAARDTGMRGRAGWVRVGPDPPAGDVVC